MNFKLTALVALAAILLAAFGVVAYNSAVNGWRLDASAFSLHRLLHGDESDAAPVHTKSFEFPIRDSVDVQLDVVHANVFIEGSDDETVSVLTMVAGTAADPDAYSIAVDRDGRQGVHVESRELAPWDESAPSHAEIRISIPRRASLALQVRDGQLSMESFTGPVDAVVADGTVHGTDLHGRLRVHVDNGDVFLEETQVAGTIVARGGSVESSFNDGDLVVKATKQIRVVKLFGNLTAEAGGDIVAQVLVDRPRCDVHSTGGAVALALLPGARVDVDAAAARGSVNNSLPLDSISADLPPGRLEGPMNGGGAPVTVRADHGSIRLDAVGGER